MSSLSIDNAEIRANIGLVLGLSRSESGWDAVVQDDMDRIIRAGRRKFFLANDWGFLDFNKTLITEAPVEVTASCAAGVVTITVGTAPTSPNPIDNWKLVPQTDRGVYDIADDTPLTLSDTSVTFASQKVKFHHYRIALPDNFAAFIDPIVVENWQDGMQLREYATLPEFQTRGIANRLHFVAGPPEIFSLNQDVDAETGNFSYFIQMYPLVDNVYVLKTKIKVQPGDALGESGEVMHPVFSETLQAAILASAETMYNRAPGVNSTLFSQLLPSAIKRDNEMRGIRQLLPRDTDNIRNKTNPIRRAGISFQQTDPPIPPIA